MADKTWVGTTGDASTASNYSPSGVPAAGDNLRFPAGAGSISSNLTALNTATISGALGAVIFEEGYTGTVGTAAQSFQFTCSRFEFAGSGLAYIDLQASAIEARVNQTAAADEGTRGLYLIGSALTGLVVKSGSVGLAARFGTTSTCATVRGNGADASIWCGAGATVTTFQSYAGDHRVRCAATTVTVYGGQVASEEIGAITTVNVNGGTFVGNSVGTITTLNARGGTSDFLQSAAARTVTTLNLYRGASVRVNDEALTITNLIVAETLVLSTASV